MLSNTERRLYRLEAFMDTAGDNIQRLAGKVEGLESDVSDLKPLTKEVAVLAQRFQQVHQDVIDVRMDIKGLAGDIRTSEKARRDEQKERDDQARVGRRWWAIAATAYGSLLIATITVLLQAFS
jgi:archaellum component FlaC